MYVLVVSCKEGFIGVQCVQERCMVLHTHSHFFRFDDGNFLVEAEYLVGGEEKVLEIPSMTGGVCHCCKMINFKKNAMLHGS